MSGAGAILSTTGGHADLHSFPLDWMQDYSRREGLMRLADGPDDCAGRSASSCGAMRS